MVASLFETAKLFFTRPVEAFERMPLTSDLMRPIAYAVIFGWLGIAVGQLYSILLRGALLPLLPDRNVAAGFAIPVVVSVVVMVIAPVLIVIGLFVWSAIVHVFLVLVGGANSGFIATVRVLAYAHTTQILQVVPICGGIVSWVWNLVLAIIGLSVAHRTTGTKAALAVLLPLLICCVCLAAAFLFFGAMFFGALARAR